MLVLVLVAGAAGAAARYWTDRAVRLVMPGTFPSGTFVINVIGSAVLGVLTGLALQHGISSDTRSVLGTGFCGAYTTFSTAMYETVELALQNERPAAIWYVAGSVVAGIAVAAIGFAVGETLA